MYMHWTVYITLLEWIICCYCMVYNALTVWFTHLLHDYIQYNLNYYVSMCGVYAVSSIYCMTLCMYPM